MSLFLKLFLKKLNASLRYQWPLLILVLILSGLVFIFSQNLIAGLVILLLSIWVIWDFPTLWLSILTVILIISLPILNLFDSSDLGTVVGSWVFSLLSVILVLEVLKNLQISVKLQILLRRVFKLKKVSLEVSSPTNTKKQNISIESSLNYDLLFIISVLVLSLILFNFENSPNTALISWNFNFASIDSFSPIRYIISLLWNLTNLSANYKFQILYTVLISIKSLIVTVFSKKIFKIFEVEMSRSNLLALTIIRLILIFNPVILTAIIISDLDLLVASLVILPVVYYILDLHLKLKSVKQYFIKEVLLEFNKLLVCLLFLSFLSLELALILSGIACIFLLRNFFKWNFRERTREDFYINSTSKIKFSRLQQFLILPLILALIVFVFLQFNLKETISVDTFDSSGLNWLYPMYHSSLSFLDSNGVLNIQAYFIYALLAIFTLLVVISMITRSRAGLSLRVLFFVIVSSLILYFASVFIIFDKLLSLYPLLYLVLLLVVSYTLLINETFKYLKLGFSALLLCSFIYPLVILNNNISHLSSAYQNQTSLNCPDDGRIIFLPFTPDIQVGDKSLNNSLKNLLECEVNSPKTFLSLKQNSLERGYDSSRYSEVRTFQTRLVSDIDTAVDFRTSMLSLGLSGLLIDLELSTDLDINTYAKLRDLEGVKIQIDADLVLISWL